MSDLTRDFPVVFSPGVNNVEQAFGKDDNEIKRMYTILTSLRGMYKSGTPPTSPNSGDKWHDSTNNVIKEWNGSVWVASTAFVSASSPTFTGVLNEAVGTPIASASTVNLTTATGNLVHITGTTTITEVTLGAGMRREVIFDGILTLTHHATNNNLPGGANITTAAGDRATYISDGTTVYCTKYQRADGTAVVSNTSLTVASEAEAIAGTDNTKAITPLRIRNAFNANGDAPVYACRAWVNFNGTGTVAIRGSGNVSSIIDNGVGDYTINFINAMPDANYCVNGLTSSEPGSSIGAIKVFSATAATLQAPATTAFRFLTINWNTVACDCPYITLSVFR